MRYICTFVLLLSLLSCRAQFQAYEVTWIDYEGLYFDDPLWWKVDTIYQVGYLVRDSKDYIILTDFYFVREEEYFITYDSIPKSNIIKYEPINSSNKVD